MNASCLFRRWGLLLLLCILMAGVVSCAEEAESGPRAWIDFPRDRSSVPAGESVSVMSHAYAREGVAEVLLSVNGEAYRRDPPEQPGAPFSQVTQEWMPAEEGAYILEVVTYDTTGEASKPATISIQVGGEIALEPTQGPTVEPTEGPTAEPTEVPTEKPTAEPTEKPTAEPTEEPPPPPPAEVSFTADALSLDQGECTTLRWEVENATAVSLDNQVVAERGSQQVCPESTATYNLHVEAPGGNVDKSLTVNVEAPPPPPLVSLQPEGQVTIERGECVTVQWDVEYATAVYINDQGVPGHGSQQVCPESTTTYNLHVEAPGGNVNKSLTINVEIPTDTTPPPVPSPYVPADGLEIECKSSQSLTWMPVSDDNGGPVVYYVKLALQVSSDNWQSVGGWGPESGKSVDASVDCGIYYRWTVRAQDGAGNYSDWAPWSHFLITGLE